MSAQQVDRWTLGSTETTVARVNPQVVVVTQASVAGGYPQEVSLTEDEWARVGRAMGWIPEGLVKLR